MAISIFGFRALWSPSFLGAIVFITIIYFLLTIKWRKDIKNSTPLTVKEGSYFVLAMIVLYAVKGSPVNLLSHIMFSVHMVQMAIFLLLVPILFIKGIPNYLWSYFIQLPGVKPIFQTLTKPVIALVVFAGLFSFYHIPVILDYVKLNETLHSVFTLILFLAAIFVAWPLINTVEGQPRMKGLHKVAFLICNAVLITPACAMIIFANAPFYETYTNGDAWMKAMELCVPITTLDGLSGLSGPELFTNISPLTDQQLGGVLMKVLQEVIFGIILCSVFFEWYKSEKENADQITQDALVERQRFNENQFR